MAPAPSYRGPERRDGDGSLTVDRRLSRLEARLDTLDRGLDTLTNRVTYLFGGIAAAAALLGLLDMYLRTSGGK